MVIHVSQTWNSLERGLLLLHDQLVDLGVENQDSKFHITDLDDFKTGPP